MKEFQGTEEEITIDFKIETLMDDNTKYSTQEYREALYKHIQQPDSSNINLLLNNQSAKQKIQKSYQNSAQYQSPKQQGIKQGKIQSSSKSPTHQQQQQPQQQQQTQQHQQESDKQTQLQTQKSFKQNVSPHKQGKESSEPSTTNSENKDRLKNKDLKKPLQNQLQKNLHSPKQQLLHYYKQIENMVKQQKSKQSLIEQEEQVCQPSKTQEQEKLINNFLNAGDLLTSKQKKNVVQNKSMGVLRNNSSSGTKITKSSVEQEVRIQYFQQLYEQFPLAKHRQSTGLLTRGILSNQIQLSGSLYSVACKAQLIPNSQQQNTSEKNAQKQNKTAQEQKKDNNTHTKNNSFTNKKNYLQYLLCQGKLK